MATTAHRPTLTARLGLLALFMAGGALAADAVADKPVPGVATTDCQCTDPWRSHPRRAGPV